VIDESLFVGEIGVVLRHRFGMRPDNWCAVDPGDHELGDELLYRRL
jgi:hypothetical protein